LPEEAPTTRLVAAAARSLLLCEFPRAIEALNAPGGVNSGGPLKERGANGRAVGFDQVRAHILLSIREMSSSEETAYRGESEK